MEFMTDIGIHDSDTRIELKQEPHFLETSMEMKYESDDNIRSELPSFASVFIVQPDSEIQQDGIKAEIKEEPVWFEGTSVELNSESEKHMHFGTQGNTAGEDQTFLLPESKGLDSKYTRPCHEKRNTNKALGGNNACISRFDEKVSYRCKLCGKCFKLSSGLQMHTATHENKRIFKCDKCDKTFTTASSLNAHILIFEAKRQHSCNVCDKSFHTGTSLKRHSLIHEVEKPLRV